MFSSSASVVADERGLFAPPFGRAPLGGNKDMLEVLRLDSLAPQQLIEHADSPTCNVRYLQRDHARDASPPRRSSTVLRRLLLVAGTCDFENRRCCHLVFQGGMHARLIVVSIADNVHRVQPVRRDVSHHAHL